MLTLMQKKLEVFKRQRKILLCQMTHQRVQKKLQTIYNFCRDFRLQSTPFFLSHPANDAGAREGTGARCAAARDPVPLPRTGVVRWMGEKNGLRRRKGGGGRQRGKTKTVLGINHGLFQLKIDVNYIMLNTVRNYHCDEGLTLETSA